MRRVENVDFNLSNDIVKILEDWGILFFNKKSFYP